MTGKRLSTPLIFNDGRCKTFLRFLKNPQYASPLVFCKTCGYERKKLFRFDTEYCERGGETGKERRIYKVENQHQMPVVGSFLSVCLQAIVEIVM